MAKLTTLPNIRKLFLPDPGYVIFDADLSGADAQVVAWEAEDEDLKAAFRSGIKIHAKNAEDMFGTRYTQAPGDRGNKSTPKGKLYDQCKRAIHATNYGASAMTLARTPDIGWTVHEAELFQRKWFSLHPGIKAWHRRVEQSLATSRSVRNAYGYEIRYFDRIQSVFPQALAWIPQSTVALVTFKGKLKMQQEFPEAEFLLQVHDSWVFQLPRPLSYDYARIRKALEVPVPYPDPLTIPWGLARSDVSWGDCVDVKELEEKLAKGIAAAEAGKVVA